jgi:hypothetical protein
MKKMLLLAFLALVLAGIVLSIITKPFSCTLPIDNNSTKEETL